MRALRKRLKSKIIKTKGNSERTIVMRSISLAVLIVIAGLVQYAQSSPISSQIAYQGILTDGAGNPLKDTVYNLQFSLHTDSVGDGNLKWEEEKEVTTKSGMFSHMLGSVKPFDTLSFSSQYWLSIKRGGDDIGQRVRLGVAPYAMRAKVADSAGTAERSRQANRATVADSAGKVDGRNIIANSIDSTKISNGAVTTNEILNGTIQTLDVASSFKAPFATTADTAINIRLTAIKEGSIGTPHISSIDGQKITPDFGSQTIRTSGSIIGSKFYSKSHELPIKAQTINKTTINDLESFSCYLVSVGNIYGYALSSSASVILQTASSDIAPSIFQLGLVNHNNAGLIRFSTIGEVPSGTYTGGGMNGIEVSVDLSSFSSQIYYSNAIITVTKIGGE